MLRPTTTFTNSTEKILIIWSFRGDKRRDYQRSLCFFLLTCKTLKKKWYCRNNQFALKIFQKCHFRTHCRRTCFISLQHYLVDEYGIVKDLAGNPQWKQTIALKIIKYPSIFAHEQVGKFCLRCYHNKDQFIMKHLKYYERNLLNHASSFWSIKNIYTTETIKLTIYIYTMICVHKMRSTHTHTHTITLKSLQQPSFFFLLLSFFSAGHKIGIKSFILQTICTILLYEHDQHHIKNVTHNFLLASICYLILKSLMVWS